MLAGTAAHVGAALAQAAPAAVTGARASRSTVTARRFGSSRARSTTSPDGSRRSSASPAISKPNALVLDAEAIALRPGGPPEPFQVTVSRFSTAGERMVPLTVLAFDVLHLDGEDLLDLPLIERAGPLAALVPQAARVPREVCVDAAAAQTVFDAAVAAGYEGVVVKALDAPYAAGRRGAGWLKVKPVHTLDSSCWPPSGGTAVVAAGSPTSTWGPVMATASRWPARPSRA